MHIHPSIPSCVPCAIHQQFRRVVRTSHVQQINTRHSTGATAASICIRGSSRYCLRGLKKSAPHRSRSPQPQDLGTLLRPADLAHHLPPTWIYTSRLIHLSIIQACLASTVFSREQSTSVASLVTAVRSDCSGPHIAGLFVYQPA